MMLEIIRLRNAAQHKVLGEDSYKNNHFGLRPHLSG